MPLPDNKAGCGTKFLQRNGNNSYSAKARNRQKQPSTLQGGKKKRLPSDTTHLSVCVSNVSILLYSLPIPSKEIFGGQQAFHSHGTSCMESSSRHSNFGSKAISETVAEPSRCIDMDTCTVYPPEKLLSQSGILCRGSSSLSRMRH